MGGARRGVRIISQPGGTMIYLARRAIGIVAVAGALGLAALAASVAQARARGADSGSPGNQSWQSSLGLDSCGPSELSQPFAPWWDFAQYELVPGGDFESPGWTLTGGAQLVAGSEPYAATGTLGAWSLALPAGASAQSPSTCVDAAYPSVRLFIAGTGAVAVSLVDGGLVIPAGVALAGGWWQPTPVLLTEAPVLGLLAGGSAQVALQLTGVIGSPQVDDVFLDPWNRG
jgi:hypothetical protein